MSPPNLQYKRPEHVLDKLYSILEENKGTIGLRQLQYADETFVVEYPCAIVAADHMTKADHGTHTFIVMFYTLVYVLHAKMMVSRSTRNREDLLMVSNIIELLEGQRTLEEGSNVIRVTCTHESPDVVAYKKEPVVGTRMLIETEARVRWR